MTIRLKLALVLLAIALIVGVKSAKAQSVAAEALGADYFEIFGEVELEATGFFSNPQFAGQDRDDFSIAAEPTVLVEWLDGDVVFRFTPFARFSSQDSRRTHADVRELKVDGTFGDFSFTFGADTVFWGKTEVVHLVDIINQTDQVEAIDDEARLGQPMIRLGYLTEFGELSAFYMPYFRERTFPGESGRLRSNPAVDTESPIYDADAEAEEFTPSFALRFAGSFGDIDLGVSGFHGLGRDPAFVPSATGLQPFYEIINQVGIDAQYTWEATLFKFEGIWREGQRNLAFEEENFVAATGGFEHTLFGVADTNADLGIIAEYAWDSRGNDSLSAFQDDLIGGFRLALNDEEDTTLLLTGSIDTNDASMTTRLEAETRIGENWKLLAEGQGFFNSGSGINKSPLADDSFLRVKLKYFFGG
ncbi:MAG: hypothetical protein AAF293_05280 [Pseudomonadota bacterium]